MLTGIMLPNGKINWNCPCLGGVASGPCAIQFREAFSCFHYSSSSIKGIECMQEFEKLQDCMKKFPRLYDNNKTNKAFSESK
jgi:intermembrane space import and assembly protein 40